MKKNNISDKLRKAASSSVKADGKPHIQGAEELVDKVINLKKELEDLEVAYAATESELINVAYEKYDEERKNRRYSNSIIAEGKETNGAAIIFSDKFSNLPIEMEAELRKKDPRYDDHFVEVRKLEVKRDNGKTISDELIGKIMEALEKAGLDFDEIFNVKVEIGTKKGLAERFNELPENVKGILKQAKPSIRNLTEDRKVI